VRPSAAPTLAITELPFQQMELNEILKLEEASRVSSLSTDTLVRKYKHWIIKISERRCGMRRGHALMAAAGR
jgi:hypothetical protein